MLDYDSGVKTFFFDYVKNVLSPGDYVVVFSVERNFEAWPDVQ